MRWQLILQFTAGLAVLFAFGWYTSASYVDGPADQLMRRVEAAEASSVASNVAMEWERARSAHRSIAEAAASSPVIASLGGVVVNPDARAGAIKAALEGVISLAGGRGDAALINERGESIGGSGEASGDLVNTNAVKDAQSGAVTVRFETIGGSAKIVAAAPVRADGEVRGVLVIATSLDEQRLNAWNAQGAVGTAVALATKTEVVASTVPDGKNQRPALAAFEQKRFATDRASYAIVHREISDDAGGVIRVFGLSKGEGIDSRLIVQHVRFLVLALGVFSALLILIGLLLAPMRERIEIAPAPEEEGDTTLPGEPMMPAPVPMAGPLSESVEDRTYPSVPRSISTNIVKPSKAPEQAPVSPFSATLADTALRAGIEGLPLSSNPPPERSQAFDEIANAVFAPPPRPNADRLMTDRPTLPERPSISDEMEIYEEHNAVPSQMVEPDEDLPMPVEHLQLPGLREPVAPRGSGSPNAVRGPNRAPNMSNAPNMGNMSNAPNMGNLPNAPNMGNMSNAPGVPARMPVMQPSPPPVVPQPSRSSASPSRMPQQPQPMAAQQRGPLYGGSPSAVPLPSSQSARGQLGDDPWRAPSANQIANATTQPMNMPAQEPRRFTTTGDIPLPPSSVSSHNGRESMSSPPMASSRPYVAPTPGGTPLPMTGTPLPTTSRELPMPFDEEHYRVVYNEFVGSKARLGEAVDNITFEGFSSKLRSSEKELIDRHGCRAVRFQVLVKDRQVSLRPQLVR